MKGLPKLRVFDKDHPAPVDTLVAMHRTFIPDSLVCRLGPQFMRRFYYGALVEEDLVVGVTAHMDGKIVGMCAGTPDSNQFMTRGIRQRPGAFALALVETLFTHPMGLLRWAEAARLLFSRSRRAKAPREKQPDEVLGETFTTVVLPDYRGDAAAHFPMKISNMLGTKVGQLLMQRGVTNIRMVTKPLQGRQLKQIDELKIELRTEHAPGWKMSLWEIYSNPYSEESAGYFAQLKAAEEAAETMSD